jgi:hypothetical protein
LHILQHDHPHFAAALDHAEDGRLFLESRTRCATTPAKP